MLKSVVAVSDNAEASKSDLFNAFDSLSDKPKFSKKNRNIRNLPRLISAMAFLKAIVAVAFLKATHAVARVWGVLTLALVCWCAQNRSQGTAAQRRTWQMRAALATPSAWS